MLTNANATVYNKYVSAGAEVYQRTQIVDPDGDYSVAWENRKGSNVLRTGGTIAADQAAIFIPMSDAPDGYTDPKAWQALVTKTGKWTLQVGDYIVKGLVTDAISGSFTISSLKAKYDDVLQISSVDTYDAGPEDLQHWQVGAK